MSDDDSTTFQDAKSDRDASPSNINGTLPGRKRVRGGNPILPD